jgi:hypothetical protein
MFPSFAGREPRTEARLEGAAEMASVVEFKRVGLQARPSSRSPQGSAEIVLFPGVRYERTVEETSRCRSRRRSRQRDHLDFED